MTSRRARKTPSAPASASNARIFISWSKPRSEAYAKALREFLSGLCDTFEPWMSSTDIDNGAQWWNHISEEISKAPVVIVCLATGVTESAWLMFEAGAGWRKDQCVLLPVIFDDIRLPHGNPLSGLTPCVVKEQEPVRQMVQSVLNQLCPGDHALHKKAMARFDVYWGEFAGKVGQIRDSRLGVEAVPTKLDDIGQLGDLVARLERVVANFAEPRSDGMGGPTVVTAPATGTAVSTLSSAAIAAIERAASQAFREEDFHEAGLLYRDLTRIVPTAIRNYVEAARARVRLSGRPSVADLEEGIAILTEGLSASRHRMDEGDPARYACAYWNRACYRSRGLQDGSADARPAGGPDLAPQLALIKQDLIEALRLAPRFWYDLPLEEDLDFYTQHSGDPGHEQLRPEGIEAKRA
jgi:hypothetical protein